MEEEVIDKAAKITDAATSDATAGAAQGVEKVTENLSATADTVKETLGLDLGNVAMEDLVSLGTSFCTKLVAAIIVLLIGRFIIKRIAKLVKKVMTKRNVEASLFTFVESLVNITLNFILVIIVISILGIETSSFVALFASAGVAIGMALSGTLQNLAGGVMVLIFHPYRVGDVIEAQGFVGCVKQIQIFNTVLTTPDNQTIIIPNGSLSTGSLKNYSAEEFRRVDLNVEVAYGTKPDAVRDVLNRLIDADNRIMKEGAHAPAIPMTTMSASSIVFQMRIWTSSANYWGVLFDMTENVYNELTAAGIEIPFQQLDVHVKQA